MKIIQVIPDLGLAGAEIMVENLTYGLVAREQDVLVISLYDLHTAITDRLESKGIKVKYLGKKSGFDPAIIFKMRRIIKTFQPSVIHTHRYTLPYVFLASIGLKVKLVHTVHNIAQKEQTKVGRCISKCVFWYFHVTPVALSSEIQKSICDVYQLAAQNVPVVFNGVDLSRCMSKGNQAIDEPFKFLHIGRFMDVKNHRLLLNAFAQTAKWNSNMKLQLIGNGELYDSMKQLSEQLGIAEKVEFLGLQSDVYPYLHNADVFVLPSKYEGVPMSLIEAMGTGLPIIASAVGGVSDMLTDDENALLIQPNTEELENAMERLYLDKNLREKLGNNALRRSADFSASEMARKYLDVYTKET